MTLDEAITKYKEITNKDTKCPMHCMLSCDKCVQESGQIAEWLEELRDYQNKNKMVVRVDVENMDSIKDKINELSKYAENQYSNGIDDYKNKIKEELDRFEVQNIDTCVLYDLMDREAERLKVCDEE